jgi:hypothetical protein
MNQPIFILGYCLFSFAVSAVAMKFLKTAWVYFLVSATLPPMLFIGGVSLWHGYLDAWSDIAFIVSWLIAFGCALVYYVIIRLAGKKNGGKAHE